MTAYLVRRLLQTIPVLVLTSVFVFLLLHLQRGRCNINYLLF